MGVNDDLCGLTRQHHRQLFVFGIKSSRSGIGEPQIDRRLIFVLVTEMNVDEH